jgi:tetraacyldisaccharide 4'-kinase
VRLADSAARVWYGESVGSRIVRALISPFSTVFGVIASRRNSAFDQLPPDMGPIPALSVGNLSVGGTGKTPVSAWFASRFRDLGAHPAIVMRGYGEDEVLVHRMLNPDVPVYVNADRPLGVQEAALGGADVAILDDAFQHRRAARVADVVLLSADRWTGAVRLLPAGPFREPMSALRRASVVIITVKAAAESRVAELRQAVQGTTGAPVVTVDLAPASFVTVPSGQLVSMASMQGRRVLAVAGIGDPGAFELQLQKLGLLTSSFPVADHQVYEDRLIAQIVHSAEGRDAVVCTLKDAVKLGPRWPSAGIELLYLSQSVVLRDGTEALDDIIRSVLAARRNR